MEQIVEVFDPEELKRRCCLCRNPQTAGREGSTRERLLERTRAELDEIAGLRVAPAQRRWEQAWAGVLEHSKMGKFVRWDVIARRPSWSFDQDKRIAAEKLFDGCLEFEKVTTPNLTSKRSATISIKVRL